MLDWREIWRSGWPRKYMASSKAVHSNTCRMSSGNILLKLNSKPHRFDSYHERFSDFPNLPLLFLRFQTLTVARNELESSGEAFFQSLKGIRNRNATESLAIRRIGEISTSFTEKDTTRLDSEFIPEPTRLQADGHIYHTDMTASSRDAFVMRISKYNTSTENI
ncbi:hypothetical protein TNCV_4920701 [Trichonephila clavipes]|nr:hypothetical protein TNCV_4920701 [Trichonephila clavipes]